MLTQSAQVLADVAASVQGPTQHPNVLRYDNIPLSPSVPRSVPHQHFTILNLIERLGYGCVVVDRHRRIIQVDAAAQTMLDRAGAVAGQNSSRYQYALRELIDRSGLELKLGSLIWIATSCDRGIAVLLGQFNNFSMDQKTTIALLDLDIFPAPNPTTLKRLFGLTFAEARLAFHLAQGSTPKEIAKILRVSRATIGSQLGAIFSKTHTKRQATLVALLARIAVLP